MSSTELAYLAGLIDGEGTILIRKNVSGRRRSPNYTAQVQVKMTDAEPVILLHTGFGGSFSSNQRTSKGKQVFSWLINGRKAEAFIRAILPFLKIPRRIANAKRCLDLMTLMKVKNGSTPLSDADNEARERLYQETKAGGVH